jgi:hypothetical protein
MSVRRECVAKVRQRPIPLVGVKENGLLTSDDADGSDEGKLRFGAQITSAPKRRKARALRIWGADLRASRFRE